MRPFLADFVDFAGRRRMAAATASMLLGGVLEGVSLAFLVPMMAVLTGAGGGRLQRLADGAFTRAGATTPLAKLAILLVAFVAVMIVRALVLMARDRLLATLQHGFVARERLRLIDAIADARWQNVAGLRHARVTSALTAEIGRVSSAAQLILQTGVSLVMLAAQLALALALSPGVGLTALALIAGGAVFIGARLNHSTRYGELLGGASLRLVDTAAQLLGGLKAAAAENRQGAFVADFAATSDAIVARQLAYQRRVTAFRVATSTAAAAAGAIILLVGVSTGGDTAALIAALVILSRMVSPLLGVQQNVEMLATLAPAHGVIAALMTELRGDAPPAVPGDATIGDGPLRLAGVRYLHAADAGIHALDLTVAPGEIVGVVGASGAGKTTLIDLVAGLIEPQAGEIHVGATRLDGRRLAAWRARIAYVGQEPYLTNDSIRRNLGDAGDGRDDAALWRALEQARIADVVRAMPDALDTNLGERGVRLSGGERQRIALARAILRRPRLLILDEATNAIDVPAEAAILETITRLDPAMTIFVVAHRQETLRPCTRILTIEHGRLVADDAVVGAR